MALCVLACVLSVAPVAAQTRMQMVERLYSSAAYEEALAALDTPEADRDEHRLESAEYRILCLLGIGEIERAEAAIAALVISYPDYSPNPALFSPSRQQQFNAVRQQVLPRIQVLPRLEAAASSQTRSNPDGGSAAAAEESKAEPATPPAVGMQGGETERVVSTSGSTPVYDVASTGVVAPVPLKPILPPMPLDGVTPNPGLFEILIDESGRVRSASVRRSVSAQYDALVLRESAKWRFKPAMRDGQPVPFRKLVEIYAVPLASLQR